MPLPKNANTPGFRAGLAMRKKVLGADYVERAIANADFLGMPFQEVATEMAWGKVWTRPGLDLASRSLVTLAMCIALNRPNEIKIHLRGAIRNGVTLLQIRELLLHSFMYCGGPAALDACATVRAALPEIQAAEKAAKAAAKKGAPGKVAAKKATGTGSRKPAARKNAAK
jgi:4-carboxymuconolactone decarboxylase